MTRTPFADQKGQPIVYVRAIEGEDLPDELKGSDARLYALHDADGNRLAVTQDRRMAFALARRNDLKPLSVH